MATESEPSAEQGPPSEEPRLAVPEPPPPVDVGGSDLATHSAKPDRTNTFFTEGVHEKRRK